MSSAIHAIVKGTILPPIDDTMYSGARCEKGPMTGVTTSKAKTTIAIIFENKMIGHRRPRKGLPFLLCALSQKTNDWNGCDPNGCIVKINVKRRVFQDVKKPRMVRAVYGLPSGFLPALDILSWAI
ncbi:hypothetical protein SLS60_002369 [Paraconiothyrium brasiliense]|uniref:Uncharacterized protein n=1 Tax=Paraconiothyrium brasiliense TaxID=300254 RepID=A0ABR3S1Z1_9PLEO